MKTGIEIDYVIQNINGKDRLVAEDIAGLLIPRKGDLINLKWIERNYLEEYEKGKIFKVEEVEFQIPNRVIVRIYSE